MLPGAFCPFFFREQCICVPVVCCKCLNVLRLALWLRCRGRILASYSCEINYWNYNRPEDVGELPVCTLASNFSEFCFLSASKTCDVLRAKGA